MCARQLAKMPVADGGRWGVLRCRAFLILFVRHTAGVWKRGRCRAAWLKHGLIEAGGRPAKRNPPNPPSEPSMACETWHVVSMDRYDMSMHARMPRSMIGHHGHAWHHDSHGISGISVEHAHEHEAHGPWPMACDTSIDSHDHNDASYACPMMRM